MLYFYITSRGAIVMWSIYRKSKYGMSETRCHSFPIQTEYQAEFSFSICFQHSYSAHNGLDKEWRNHTSTMGGGERGMISRTCLLEWNEYTVKHIRILYIAMSVSSIPTNYDHNKAFTDVSTTTYTVCGLHQSTHWDKVYAVVETSVKDFLWS